MLSRHIGPNDPVQRRRGAVVAASHCKGQRGGKHRFRVLRREQSDYHTIESGRVGRHSRKFEILIAVPFQELLCTIKERWPLSKRQSVVA
jgi:hypothetical protein